MSFFPRDVAAPAPAPKMEPLVEWEEPECLLCGGRTWSPLVEAPDAGAEGTGLWFVVVQCQDCGLCFTNPRPSVSSMGQFRAAGRRQHPRDAVAVSWLRAFLRRLAGPRGGQGLMPIFGAGRMLDVGCANTSYLTRMHRRGWKVTGLGSAPIAKRVRAEAEVSFLSGSLPHRELRAGSFELVTFWHSLACAHDPLGVLREAHRLLAPGGKVFVVAPNIDSLPFRWFGHAWHGLDLPRHLTHFAPWTLYLMLHKAGFRTGPIRMVTHSGWLRRSAGLACQTPLATRRHHWLRRKPFSRLAAWYSSCTYQADCMMVTAER
jgi:SAM-dependent methyltransferase